MDALKVQKTQRDLAGKAMFKLLSKKERKIYDELRAMTTSAWCDVKNEYYKGKLRNFLSELSQDAVKAHNVYAELYTDVSTGRYPLPPYPELENNSLQDDNERTVMGEEKSDAIPMDVDDDVTADLPRVDNPGWEEMEGALFPGMFSWVRKIQGSPQHLPQTSMSSTSARADILPYVANICHWLVQDKAASYARLMIAFDFGYLQDGYLQWLVKQRELLEGKKELVQLHDDLVSMIKQANLDGVRALPLEAENITQLRKSIVHTWQHGSPGGQELSKMNLMRFERDLLARNS